MDPQNSSTGEVDRAEAARMLAEAEERSTTMVADARATADRVRLRHSDTDAAEYDTGAFASAAATLAVNDQLN